MKLKYEFCLSVCLSDCPKDGCKRDERRVDDMMAVIETRVVSSS